MNSSLYQCRVLHHRLHPKEHRFGNRMLFFRLDLDELGVLDQQLRLFSRNHRNLYSLRDADYSPPEETDALPEPPLKEKIARRLRDAGYSTDGLRVELITLPRIGGYWFNPVSFYFCRGPENRPICALAEVTNTFREVKTFLIPPESPGSERFTLRVPKQFYVSPFSELDLDFEFAFRSPGRELVIRIDEYAGSRLMLHSLVVGREQPLSDRSLLWFAIRFPFLSLQVMAAIHWQALKLYLKKIPHHKKAANPHLQTGLRRPHASLRQPTNPSPASTRSP